MKEWKKCFRLKLEFSACLTGVEHGRLLIGAKIKILTAKISRIWKQKWLKCTKIKKYSKSGEIPSSGKKCFGQKLEFSACVAGIEHGRLLIGAKIKILTTLNSSKIKGKVPKTIDFLRI